MSWKWAQRVLLLKKRPSYYLRKSQVNRRARELRRRLLCKTIGYSFWQLNQTWPRKLLLKSDIQAKSLLKTSEKPLENTSLLMWPSFCSFSSNLTEARTILSSLLSSRLDLRNSKFSWTMNKFKLCSRTSTRMDQTESTLTNSKTSS